MDSPSPQTTLGFPQSVRWNNVTVRVAAVRFDPLEAQHSDELGIRLFVPDLREEDFEDAHNAILRAIDHGLGEERFANAIQFTEIETMSSHANPEELISLLELDTFISWREKKRHT